MPRHLPGEGYPAPHCTEDELRQIRVPTGPAPGAPRRVRTQAERDADGTAWRPRADEHAPEPFPESPGWTARTAALFLLLDAVPMWMRGGWYVVLCRRVWNFPPLPPRRRWWHRYTRRSL